jgi:hypothetical protein
LPKLWGVLAGVLAGLATLLRHDEGKGRQVEEGKGRKALASGTMLLAKSAAIKATDKVEVVVLVAPRLLFQARAATASCCCIVSG